MGLVTFNGFDFMFKRKAVPLHITTYHKDGTVDQELDVTEPLTAGGNIAMNGGKPAVVVVNGNGGYTPTETTTWVSRTPDFRKGTKVVDVQLGKTYKVTQSTPVRNAPLTYYQLEDNDDDNTSGLKPTEGGTDDVQTDSGQPDNWY